MCPCYYYNSGAQTFRTYAKLTNIFQLTRIATKMLDMPGFKFLQTV